MIKSFKHKGLEQFFMTGNTSGIQAAHATKIRDRLTFLHSVMTIDNMDIPGYRLHELKSKLKAGC